MANALVKAGMVWVIENKGEDFERWIRGELRSERDPHRRNLLKWGLKFVQEARADPEGFVDDLGTNYDTAVALYQEYKRRRADK